MQTPRCCIFDFVAAQAGIEGRTGCGICGFGLDRLPCKGEVVRERRDVAASKNGDDGIVVSRWSHSKITRGSSRGNIKFGSPSKLAASQILCVVRSNELRDKKLESIPGNEKNRIYSSDRRVSREKTWPRGPMDKASAYGAVDCRFESCRGQDVLPVGRQSHPCVVDPECPAIPHTYKPAMGNNRKK